jgi:hypothetical protein
MRVSLCNEVVAGLRVILEALPNTSDLILRRREAPSRRMDARFGRTAILRDAASAQAGYGGSSG